MLSNEAREDPPLRQAAHAARVGAPEGPHGAEAVAGADIPDWCHEGGRTKRDAFPLLDRRQWRSLRQRSAINAVAR